MEGAIDVLNEYFKSIGGRPEPKGQKRKGRPSLAGRKSESETLASSTKRAKADKEEKKVAQWSPPPGSWEHDVHEIDTVEQTKNPKTGELESSHTSCGTIIKRHNILSNTSTKSVRKRCVAMTIEIVLLLMRCRCWHTMRVT